MKESTLTEKPTSSNFNDLVSDLVFLPESAPTTPKLWYQISAATFSTWKIQLWKKAKLRYGIFKKMDAVGGGSVFNPQSQHRDIDRSAVFRRAESKDIIPEAWSRRSSSRVRQAASVSYSSRRREAHAHKTKIKRYTLSRCQTRWGSQTNDPSSPGQTKRRKVVN